MAYLPTGTKEPGLRLLSDQKISLLVLAGIDAKGYMNVHFNAYFYGEMTFILVNGETSKRQEKQLYADWRPVNETVLVQNIIYRMTAEKFEYETNSTQMPFVE